MYSTFFGECSSLKKRSYLSQWGFNVSVKEISDIIQILHANKASEPDVICHKMLKLCPSKIALPLQVIFNKSLQQSKYPTNWKLDHIIAVFN